MKIDATNMHINFDTLELGKIQMKKLCALHDSPNQSDREEKYGQKTRTHLNLMSNLPLWMTIESVREIAFVVSSALLYKVPKNSPETIFLMVSKRFKRIEKLGCCGDSI